MEFNVKDKVEYIIALVNEFARVHKLSDSQATLTDTRTSLYFQSPGYVYDYLEKKIATGKIS